MGVLDALTILGAGVGRGYRGSQELQRQIAEQKRKALLEEREQSVRERAAESQIQLNAAQQQAAAVEMAMTKFGLGEKERGVKQATSPITPGGRPLRAKILGNDVELPGTMETLTQQGDLFRQLSEERFKSEHPDYFTNYPPAGTAAAEIRNSPEARGRDYIRTILSGNPPMELTEDPETYSLRVQNLMTNKLNFLKAQDPDAIETLFNKSKKKNKSKGAESDTSFLDDEAIEPESNRFKVKVK